MKISKLIEQLQNTMKVDGDLEVMIAAGIDESADGSVNVPFAGYAIGMSNDDKAEHILLCDEHTLDAFRG